MGVPDAGGLLDGPADVVVGVAEFVGEQLNLVGGLADGVVDHGVAGGSRKALLGGCGNEVELVDLLVSDGGVNHSPRLRVLELPYVSPKQTSVHPLAHINVHELSLSYID